MRFPLLDIFKVLHIERYSWDADLADHMKNYRAHLVLHGTPNEIVCWAFPLTLKQSARDCFGKLPPKSIDMFKTLGRKFLTQFWQSEVASGL